MAHQPIGEALLAATLSDAVPQIADVYLAGRTSVLAQWN
jgi:hypothetical protein